MASATTLQWPRLHRHNMDLPLHIQFRTSVLAVAWVAFAGFICASTVKIPQREIVENKPKLSLDHFFLGRAWLMALNILFFGLCWGIMSNYVAIYGQERLGITDGTGIFFMLLSAGLMVSRIFGTKALRDGKLTENCARGVLISLAGYTMFALGIGPVGYYGAALLIDRERADVPRLPQHVHQRCAPRPARHGQFVDSNILGSRHGHRHPCSADSLYNI